MAPAEVGKPPAAPPTRLIDAGWGFGGAVERVLLPPAKLQLAALSCAVKGQACSLVAPPHPPSPTCATGRGREQIFRRHRVAYSGRRHLIGAATPSPGHHPGSSYEVAGPRADLPPSPRLRTPGDAIGSGLRLRARVTTRDQATRPNMTSGASSGCGDAVCRGRDVMRPP